MFEFVRRIDRGVGTQRRLVAVNALANMNPAMKLTADAINAIQIDRLVIDVILANSRCVEQGAGTVRGPVAEDRQAWQFVVRETKNAALGSGQRQRTQLTCFKAVISFYRRRPRGTEGLPYACRGSGSVAAPSRDGRGVSAVDASGGQTFAMHGFDKDARDLLRERSMLSGRTAAQRFLSIRSAHMRR